MAKFVDINSLTEKVNPDGNEQIQVSDTCNFSLPSRIFFSLREFISTNFAISIDCF